ncbi:MAG: glycosyltransferase family 2 protein [Pyrinomonadaceae bacterium]
MKISAVVITLNEELNIRDLCESISWVDEIIIVDSHSTDSTVEIARTFTDKIIKREFTSFQDQHEFTDSQATCDWLLWIDADERVTPELRAEIEGLKSREDEDLPDGFWIPRKTWYLDRWIKHSGWYPDRQMRLYRKEKSYWGGIPPHETARVDGRVEKMKGEILHYTQRDLSGYHAQVDRFTSQTASHLFKTGARVGGVGIFFHPIAAFFRTYLYKQGFRDGIPGLIIAMFTAYYVFLRYAKLWEHNNIEK